MVFETPILSVLSTLLRDNPNSLAISLIDMPFSLYGFISQRQNAMYEQVRKKDIVILVTKDILL